MPTVTKTWTFDVGSEGLADAGAHPNILFSYESGDGSPSSGCVKFTCNVTGVSSSEYGRRPTTGETWETWGVPPGAVVTQAQITDWRSRKFALATNDGIIIKVRIINSSGTTVHSSGDLISTGMAVPPPGGWTDEAAGPVRNIDALYQVSSTDVRLEIEGQVSTGALLANLDYRLDSIELTLTYDEGAGGGVGTRAWAFVL